MDELVKKVFDIVSDKFESVSGAHDFEHTQRVYNLAMRIGKIEKADLQVLGVAAFLHDIARNEEYVSKGKICHAVRGSEVAEEILIKLGVDDLEFISKVKHCILAHRKRTSTVPVSIEAKVLFDSDKLDAIGAIGIGRDFQFAGEVGANFHDKNVVVSEVEEYSSEDTAYYEFLKSLQFVKDKIITSEGKKIACSRHDFMVAFFERLNLEVDGDL